jgi:hypothetical protein
LLSQDGDYWGASTVAIEVAFGDASPATVTVPVVIGFTYTA